MAEGSRDMATFSSTIPTKGLDKVTIRVIESYNKLLIPFLTFGIVVILFYWIAARSLVQISRALLIVCLCVPWIQTAAPPGVLMFTEYWSARDLLSIVPDLPDHNCPISYSLSSCFLRVRGCIPKLRSTFCCPYLYTVVDHIAHRVFRSSSLLSLRLIANSCDLMTARHFMRTDWLVFVLSHNGLDTRLPWTSANGYWESLYLTCRFFTMVDGLGVTLCIFLNSVDSQPLNFDTFPPRPHPLFLLLAR